MPTAYSRVTVVSGARRVDLALPSVLPLFDVVPQLLRFCAPDERPQQPAAWTLGRLGGPSLDLGHSLADAGVLDGDVLELRSARAANRPAYVEDVRDAIEDAVDAAGGQWRSRTTAGFALTAAATGTALTALLPFTRQPDDPGALAAALLPAAACVTGAWWGTRRAHPGPVTLTVAAGCLWGGVAGWLAGMALGWSSPGSSPLPALAAGVAGALLVSVAARIVTPLATAHLATLAVLAIAAVVAAVTGPAWGTLTAARLVGGCAVLVIGVLPRAALAAGGLATADYRVRKSALVSRQEQAERVRQSTALVFGGVLGAATAGTLAGLELAYAESVWDRLLALAVGALLLLRSRVFSRILQMAPLRVAGCAVLAAQGVRLGSSAALRPWFVVLATALGTGLVAISAMPLSDITQARVKRALNWTESVVVVAMIVFAAAGLGLYDMVVELTG